MSTEEPLYYVSFMDIWPLPHDFMYPEFCHHQNERCIVIFMLFCLICAAKICKRLILQHFLLLFFEGELLGVSISETTRFALSVPRPSAAGPSRSQRHGRRWFLIPIPLKVPCTQHGIQDGNQFFCGTRIDYTFHSQNNGRIDIILSVIYEDAVLGGEIVFGQ